MEAVDVTGLYAPCAAGSGWLGWEPARSLSAMSAARAEPATAACREQDYIPGGLRYHDIDRQCGSHDGDALTRAEGDHAQAILFRAAESCGAVDTLREVWPHGSDADIPWPRSFLIIRPDQELPDRGMEPHPVTATINVRVSWPPRSGEVKYEPTSTAS